MTAGLAPAWSWPYSPSFCPNSPFADVPIGGGWCPWIQALANEEISAGCAAGAFCPDALLPRKSATLLLERAMRGTAAWSSSRGWYSATLLVSPVPGNAVASGQALRAACEELSNADLGHPKLLKIEPGLYDLGSSTLALPSWVDLEGAGQDITRIVGQPPVGQPILSMPIASSLRRLSVGPGPKDRKAISVVGGGSDNPRRLERVTILAQGDGVTCNGGNDGSGLEISSATVSSQGGTSNRAVASVDCQLSIADSDLRATGGQAARALDLEGSATVRGSRLTGSGGSSVSVALRTFNGNVSLADVEARAEQAGGAGQPQALNLLSATAKVRNSHLATDNASGVTLHADAASQAEVVDSWLETGLVSTTTDDGITLIRTLVDQVSYAGNLRCFEVYDESFTNSNDVDECP